MVIDSLPDAKRDATYLSLGANDGVGSRRALRKKPNDSYIRDHTLVRRIENFDPERVYWQSSAQLKGENGQPS